MTDAKMPKVQVGSCSKCGHWERKKMKTHRTVEARVYEQYKASSYANMEKEKEAETLKQN